MNNNNKKIDTTAVASEIFVIACIAGMFTFPYKAGRKFFQKYDTQEAKISGTGLLSGCSSF